LPVDVDRRPVQIAPYQPRLDWQMWFAAMSTPDQYPWTLHLVWKLLHGDAGALGLFASNPFPSAPPRYIRASLYRYRFARPSTHHYWTRERVAQWLPPLTVDDERLRDAMHGLGWKD
ncbi:MAG TPA: lipase maturation factor family protein, partial [Polyangia bacterium]|nr:lipase maturation factor family protein [Polyangia bacterium]